MSMPSMFFGSPIEFNSEFLEHLPFNSQTEVSNSISSTIRSSSTARNRVKNGKNLYVKVCKYEDGRLVCHLTKEPFKKENGLQLPVAGSWQWSQGTLLKLYGTVKEQEGAQVFNLVAVPNGNFLTSELSDLEQENENLMTLLELGDNTAPPRLFELGDRAETSSMRLLELDDSTEPPQTMRQLEDDSTEPPPMRLLEREVRTESRLLEQPESSPMRLLVLEDSTETITPASLQEDMDMFK